MSKVFIQNESGNILAKDDEPYMIDQVGTDVFVNGVRQDRLDFASDPQEQITANKLSDAQMQSIGEIDAIKGIALQNQSDVTELSASVLANTNKLNTIVSKALYPSTEIQIKKSGSTIIFATNGSMPITIGENKLSTQNGINIIARYNANIIQLNGKDISNSPIDAIIKVDTYSSYIKIGE